MLTTTQHTIPDGYNFTFAMIKPNALEKGHGYDIIKMIKNEGFIAYESKETKIEKSYAIRLYHEHNKKDFFHDLVDYTCSGPVVLICVLLEKDKGDCVSKFRDLITRKGGIRDTFGTSVRMNAIHGSDSEKRAREELSIFNRK